MCYSAMVVRQFSAYVRATGAQIDLVQFLEVLRERDEGAKITVPRAVEAWFDNPKADAEIQIKDLIDKTRTTAITALEQELFKQKKRLADADRKLVQKPTKAASESKRIAEDKVSRIVSKLGVLNDSKPRSGDGRIFPMYYAPIVMKEGNHNLIRLARYHCRLAGKPESVDRQYPGLYNARRDNIDKYWRAAFGTNHALMLVDSFYENVERDGKNAVLHFVPKPPDLMLIACLYSIWTDPKDGKRLLSFAAITDEPPPEVAATGHNRMIINIKPRNVEHWLKPQGRSDAELHDILSDRQAPYYEHEVLAA